MIFKRSKTIELKYQDAEGKEHQIMLDGLGARCVQHEIDHLNGVLFIDHLSKLKRDMIIKKLKKSKKEINKIVL